MKLIEFLLSKFIDRETLEETRARIRTNIAATNRTNIMLHAFYEGENGYYRDQK